MAAKINWYRYGTKITSQSPNVDSRLAELQQRATDVSGIVSGRSVNTMYRLNAGWYCPLLLLLLLLEFAISLRAFPSLRPGHRLILSAVVSDYSISTVVRRSGFFKRIDGPNLIGHLIALRVSVPASGVNNRGQLSFTCCMHSVHHIHSRREHVMPLRAWLTVTAGWISPACFAGILTAPTDAQFRGIFCKILLLIP